MAHLSGDEGLIEAFRRGDCTVSSAPRFEVAPEDVTPEMRAKIKAMSYGLAYGLSSFGLSKQLDIDISEANRLMDEYFERFGGVRDYLRRVVEEARVTGYTATIFGRRRYLPDLTSDNRQRRELAERVALNAPIQGSAADLIKRAMLGVDREPAADSLAHAPAGARRFVVEVAPVSRAGRADPARADGLDRQHPCRSTSVGWDAVARRGTTGARNGLESNPMPTLRARRNGPRRPPGGPQSRRGA